MEKAKGIVFHVAFLPGGGTEIFIHVRRSRLNFEIQYFLWVGYEDFVDIFGAHHKSDYI